MSRAPRDQGGGSHLELRDGGFGLCFGLSGHDTLLGQCMLCRYEDDEMSVVFEGQGSVVSG